MKTAKTKKKVEIIENDYKKISLTGNDPILNEFKGKVKIKGLFVQDVLKTLIVEWNKKN